MADDRKIAINLGISRLEYNDATRPQTAELVLSTEKHYNGGITSKATVYWVGLHMRVHAFAIGGPDGDFSATIERSAAAVRATQKAIDLQHARVFTDAVISDLTERAKAHYASIPAELDRPLDTSGFANREDRH